MSEAGAKTTKKPAAKKDTSELFTKEAAKKLSQRANGDSEEAKKIREAFEVLNEWNSKETEQDEWDENQDSEDDESDEDGEGTTRKGFDMQDIRDVAAKLPTQKQGDGTKEGGQPEVIYTQA